MSDVSRWAHVHTDPHVQHPRSTQARSPWRPEDGPQSDPKTNPIVKGGRTGSKIHNRRWRRTQPGRKDREKTASVRVHERSTNGPRTCATVPGVHTAQGTRPKRGQGGSKRLEPFQRGGTNAP
eukprot:scaffold270_cov347-Pavlova_lutheri.AAC.21